MNKLNWDRVNRRIVVIKDMSELVTIDLGEMGNLSPKGPNIARMSALL